MEREGSAGWSVKQESARHRLSRLLYEVEAAETNGSYLDFSNKKSSASREAHRCDH